MVMWDDRFGDPDDIRENLAGVEEAEADRSEQLALDTGEYDASPDQMELGLYYGEPDLTPDELD